MTNPIYPNDYYSRFDEAKHFEQHVFRAGKVLQSAEQNEIQQVIGARLKGIADAIFHDGNIIKDAQIVVDPANGYTQCQAGVIYLLGAMRGVAPKNMTIPYVGTVLVGVRLIKTIVSYLEDPTLRDPAIGLRNYQEIGASRLKYEIAWAYDTDNGEGDFYPVYTVVNGIVDAKEPPPNIDSISLAIAAYDRQSTGGLYVSNGLAVTQLADDSGNQVYSVQEGLARIYGQLVVIPAAMRIVYPAVPDLRHNVSEPHVLAGGTETVTLSQTPVKAITSIVITKEVTETVHRGTTANTSDLLAHQSVVSISLVTQAGHGTYSSSTEYFQDGDHVNWSQAGAHEPATGSYYDVTYRYEETITANSFTETTCQITGAVAGTTGHFWYDSALPRYDRLCLDKNGQIQWIKGVAALTGQVVPYIPSSMLSLATIYQSWATTGRTLSNDGTRMVTMGEIEGLHANVIDLYDLISENQMAIDVVGRITAAKKGLFADGFRDDGYRNAGVTQDCITSDETLMLNIDDTVRSPTTINTTSVTMAYSHVAVLTQDEKTSSMQINPYMSFAKIPAKVVIFPSVDNAVNIVNIETQTVVWAPSHFHFWREWHHHREEEHVISSVGTKTISISNLFLRTIQVGFTIENFGPLEQLTGVSFDGVSVINSVE